MAEFTQQQFLGASIRYFNSNIGWGQQSSTLSVGLAEDNGETFSPPTAGSPVYFAFNNWTFGGILQSWKQSNGQEGVRLFDVTVEDPRNLLEGVQLIIDSYNGLVYNVPNIYNIFGYLELNQGFGSTGVNSAGMPWYKVRDGFNSLQTTNPISLMGTPLRVDLSLLPNVGSEHRIPGPNISLMDFISDICDAGGCDFFFRLIFLNNSSVLKLYTINRRYIPDTTAIRAFISSLSNYNASSVGIEYRNEVNNKFLVGGKVQKLFVQTSNLGESGEINENEQIYPRAADNTIFPYFGLKEDGSGVKFLEGQVRGDLSVSPITANFRSVDYFDYLFDNSDNRQLDWDAGMPQKASGTSIIRFYHPFIAEVIRRNNAAGIVHPWFQPDGEKYVTDLNELRAALSGQDVWENFLFFNNTQNFITLYLSAIDNNVQELVSNIHKGKFGQNGLNLVGLFNKALVDEITDQSNNLDPDQFIAWVTANIDMQMVNNSKNKRINVADPNKIFEQSDISKRVYDVIYQFASTYFGRKYMVAVPFVAGTRDNEEEQEVTDWRGDTFNVIGSKIRTSLEPTDGGYVDSTDYSITEGQNGSEFTPVEGGEFARMVEQKVLPADITPFLTDEGKIVAFARYRKQNLLGVPIDIGDIPDDDYVEYDEYYYVKCEIEPNLVFADTRTYFSPRAVVTLPGIVGTINKEFMWQAEFIKQLVRDAAGPAYNNGVNLRNLNTALDTKFGKPIVGGDFLHDDLVRFPIAPSMIVVPLKSNIESYGPWYSIGGPGKTDFEFDENLVPWNYGSYNNMFLAGQARISEGYSTQQESETGSITFAGVPEVQLGDLLINNGPYLTDINVQIGNDGATTTYNFQTWTRRFGSIPKELFEEQRKMRLLMQKQRFKLLNKQARGLGKPEILQKGQKPKDPRRISSSSTHPYLIAEKTEQKHNIVLAPSYNAADQVSDPVGKTLSSLDTLFVPFATRLINSNDERLAADIAHLEYPSGVTGLVNATGLNPFVYPHPFNSMTRDDDEWDESYYITNSGQDDEVDGYRTFGIRMPAIFVGWGVDTNNKPVPNATPTNPGNEFADDYRTNVTQWKAGPLLTKWNDRAKGWEATSTPLKRCQTVQNVRFNGSGLADIYEFIPASGKNIKIGREWVYDWILGSGEFIPNGTKCIFYTEGDRNYIVNAACSVSDMPINY